METSRYDRFQKRKRIKNSITVINDVDANLVNSFLNSNIDQNKVDNVYLQTKEFYDTSVSSKETDEFLEKFKKEFKQGKFDALMLDCRKNVIQSITTPFGLGSIAAASDKVGGNVTTVHNANQNIYANETDKYNRKDYANTKNSYGKQFTGDSKNSIGSNFTKTQMDSNANVTDAYTGKSQRASTTSPDHIESLSQYHKDGGFMQSNTQKADFATDENNLALTDRSINQSMRDFDKKEWLEKETIDGVKNKDRFDIDKNRLKKELDKGKNAKNSHLPTNTEKTEYYLKNSASTGVKESGKMALQQAMGLVLTEFFTALFDEIMDIYKNGFSHNFDNKKFFEILAKRLEKIGNRVASKWKDVLIATKDGFLSGFISNLVTTLINMFATTAKRIVRIIREGIYAIFKAIKILIFRPKGTSFEDAMHEAKKLLASGVVISLGIIAEEAISTYFATFPYGNTISAIFTGMLTGLTLTLVVYHIDKKRDDKLVFEQLLNKTEETLSDINKMLHGDNNTRKLVPAVV